MFFRFTIFKNIFKNSLNFLFRILFLISLTISSMVSTLYADEQPISLDKAPVDLTDLASLQRGAKLFMNYCSGCHSLKYIRYNVMAKEIGIVDSSGKVLDQAVKENLMFTGDKISDTIKTAMSKEEGAAWFGTAPPDLSLVSRSRGVDWIYTYLRSFYPDPKRPWGTNNKVFPDVAMPDVLYNLRKELNNAAANIATNANANANANANTTPNKPLNPADAVKLEQETFDRAVLDLVNFLAYCGEPIQLERKKIGVWVLLFLGVFFVFAWLLKREFWKKV